MFIQEKKEAALDFRAFLSTLRILEVRREFDAILREVSSLPFPPCRVDFPDAFFDELAFVPSSIYAFIKNEKCSFSDERFVTRVFERLARLEDCLFEATQIELPLDEPSAFRFVLDDARRLASLSLDEIPRHRLSSPIFDGHTLLHWAVYFLSFHLVDELLARGAAPDAPNSLGFSAFDVDIFDSFFAHAPQTNASVHKAGLMRSKIEAWHLSSASEKGAGGKRGRL